MSEPTQPAIDDLTVEVELLRSIVQAFNIEAEPDRMLIWTGIEHAISRPATPQQVAAIGRCADSVGQSDGPA